MASVREAALAIVRHRIRYLTVVDDGTLVGLLAVSNMNFVEEVVEQGVRHVIGERLVP